MKIFSIIWDLLISFCTIVIAIVIPLQIIFDLHFHVEFKSIINVIGILFILDIPINFYKYSNSIGQYSIIEKSKLSDYFKVWFTIDLIAAIPLTLIFTSPYIPMLMLIKLLKLFKFMNQTLRKYIKYALLLRLIFFGVLAFIFVHWIACGWILIRGVDLHLAKYTNYINSLYWTVTTLTTVGYGDIAPTNNNEKLFSILIMIMGVGFYGYLIGNIATILTKRDPSKEKYLENMENLNALTMYRKVPSELEARIRDYYTYIWHKKLGTSESSVLDDLPDSLRGELSLHLKKEVIDSINLFKDTGEEFRKEISIYLKPMVLTPGDIIFKEGDEGNKMYFVIQGNLEVLSSDKTIAELKSGDFFGEIALFRNSKRNATIKAKSYCDLYYLHKNAFDYAVNKYEGIKDEIEEMIRKREN